MESQSELPCSERSPPARAVLLEVGYWWMALWLIWGDLWRHLLHKGPFYPSRVRPTAAESLIAVTQGSKRHGLRECWQKCWYLYIYIFFFSKGSTFDYVPMIALWMPNYSVITWEFVILFRVAKSEFNISRCCFSFLVGFFPPSLAGLFGFLIEEIGLWIYTHSCII